VACLESQEELPAYKDEFEDALEEGVVFNFSWGPKRIMGNGKVSGVEFVKCASVYDDEGKWSPQFDETVSKSFEADTVIIAIGQSSDLSFVGKGGDPKATADGTIEVNPLTLETSLPGVFAGGDIVTGSKNVVDAVAAGKEAAESIDRYIQGGTLLRGEKPREFIKIERPSMFADPSERILKENSLRAVPPKLSAAERKTSFKEIVGALSEEEAVQEAKRCLKYDLELEEKSKGRLAKMGKATFVLEP
jgi:NADPH-dependent glutamate synthase beta subunit-like oxidoreductase